MSYEAIGRLYGVTGNAIKKAASRLEINLPSRRKINPCETFNKDTSASLLDEAKKAFSAYWFLLSLFIGQNLCLGVVLCQIYSAWSKGEPLGFMVLGAISIIVAASYSWNAIRPYRERYKNYKQVRTAYSRLVEANRAVLELLEYVESKPKEERAEEAEELAEPVVMAVAELFFARMAYTRALKEGLELQ